MQKLTRVHSPQSIVHRRKNGFTFVEMLVVMAMVGVVMGALLTSFLIGRKSYLSADSYVQVQQEARRAFDVMVKELREARVDGPDGDSLTDQDIIPAVDRLNLQVALGYDLDDGAGAIAGCLNAQICWGEGTTQGTWVHYLVLGVGNQAQLLRCTSVASDTVIATTAACTNMRVLANNVQTFTASYDDNDKAVTLQLAIQTTSSQLAGGTMSTTPAPLVTRVRLRN